VYTKIDVCVNFRVEFTLVFWIENGFELSFEFGIWVRLGQKQNFCLGIWIGWNLDLRFELEIENLIWSLMEFWIGLGRIWI